MNVDPTERALYEQCAFVGEALSRIAREQRYSDSDYDYVSCALDVCSVLLDASYGEGDALTKLCTLWKCNRDGADATLLADVCPDGVRAFILSTHQERAER